MQPAGRLAVLTWNDCGETTGGRAAQPPKRGDHADPPSSPAVIMEHRR
ncbi:MAG: hypothetical protein JWM91_579 [Rhodospirillales bacterium]|nr:hypothetical protein [Rhodospirillales bacterium]